MRNSRRESTAAHAAEARAGWLRSDRRSLSIALLVSVCAHGVLLGAWRAQSGNAPIQPALVVVMTGVIVAPKREAPPAPVPPPSQEATARNAAPAPAHAPPAHAAPASAQPEPAGVEAPRPEPSPSESAPAPERPTAVAAASAASSAAPAASGAANPPVREAAGFDKASYYRPDQVTQGPVPDAAPPGERLAAARLVARRLVVEVFVDADGSVRKAIVVPYELSAQTAAMLEDAIATVHFTPANIDGRPVPATATSRLCFDDHGLLDTTSPECWQFDTRPAH